MCSTNAMSFGASRPIAKKGSIEGRSSPQLSSEVLRFIDASTLIGPRSFVAERISALKESGVTSLNVGLVGRTLADRLKTLAELRELCDAV